MTLEKIVDSQPFIDHGRGEINISSQQGNFAPESRAAVNIAQLFISVPLILLTMEHIDDTQKQGHAYPVNFSMDSVNNLHEPPIIPPISDGKLDGSDASTSAIIGTDIMNINESKSFSEPKESKSVSPFQISANLDTTMAPSIFEGEYSTSGASPPSTIFDSMDKSSLYTSTLETASRIGNALKDSVIAESDSFSLLSGTFGTVGVDVDQAKDFSSNIDSRPISENSDAITSVSALSDTFPVYNYELIADIEEKQTEISVALNNLSETIHSEAALEKVEKVQKLFQEQSFKIEKIVPSAISAYPDNIRIVDQFSDNGREVTPDILNEMSKKELIQTVLEYEDRLNEHGSQYNSSETNQEISHKCCWNSCVGQNYGSAEELRKHLVEVHCTQTTEGYICFWENCVRALKPFSTKHRLVAHFSTHTGEKPFSCPYDGCTKRFSRKDSLNFHIKTHSKVKQYQCSVCNKQFYQVKSLKKHEKIHKRRPKSQTKRGSSFTLEYSNSELPSAVIPSFNMGSSLLCGYGAKNDPFT